MPLISKAIPSFFNGVSQQPATLRNPSQAESSVNAYPTVAAGLQKRPPTEHVAKLRNSTASDAFTHTFKAPDGTYYVLVLLDGSWEVYDEAGNSYTGTNTYLDCNTPRTDFACVTVGEVTYIVNKTKTVAMGVATVSGSSSGTKQTFSALPSATGSGNIWEIAGDNTNRFDNYWVKDTASGVWSEWLKPGETYQLDASTMPHKLTRTTGPVAFTLAAQTFVDRKVGDKASVKDPSFVGRQIQDVFAHRDRLGYIADEFIVLSKVGAYGDFYPGTATNVLDTDPIDVSSANSITGKLRYVVPFNRALLLFSEAQQFQFSGGDTLTPRTARLDPVTQFDASTACRPVMSGQEVFFAVPRNEFTSVRNYFIDTNALTNDAADLTGHIPSYIPKDVFQMAVSTSEDCLFVLTLQERNAIYVYKFMWQDDKRVQSAWQKFTLDAGDTILGASFIASRAYLVIQRSDGVYLEKMNLQPQVTIANVGYLPALDRMTSLTGVYDSTNNWTTWTLPYTQATDIEFKAVLPSTFSGKKGTVVALTRPATTTARATGDFSANPVYVGRSYTMRHRLSELYFKDQQNLTIQSGKLQIRRMSVNFDDTGYFRVEVTAPGRTTKSYPFTGKVLGTSSMILGTPNIASGTHKFPILTQNKDCVIEFVNDSPLPCALQSGEWEGEFTIKSRRQV